MNGFVKWWRRRQDRKRKREQYRGLSVHEWLDYATTEQEIRDAVIDYNGEIVRVDRRRGAFEPMTSLLNPHDVVKECRDRRRGNA